MKKAYINPKVKVITLRTETLLDTSPLPDRFDFDPSKVYEEEEGIAD